MIVFHLKGEWSNVGFEESGNCFLGGLDLSIIKMKSFRNLLEDKDDEEE